MADKVKLSKDGNSIDFVQSESIPTSVKKFRQSPEIEGFYRFIFENDLQKEAYEILERIVGIRKAKKLKEKQDAMPAKKLEKAEAKKAEAPKKEMPPVKKAAPPVKAAAVKAAPVKAAPAKAAPAKKAAAPVSAKKKPTAKKR
jgi:hypothetical protein